MKAQEDKKKENPTNDVVPNASMNRERILVKQSCDHHSRRGTPLPDFGGVAPKRAETAPGASRASMEVSSTLAGSHPCRR
jgi:hypothetical protein